MDQNATTKAAAPSLSVTINGGKELLNSATVPVRWWVSDEIINKNPKYILFFEQGEKEKNGYQSDHCGHRYLVELTSVVKFLEFFSSGRHRMIAVVFQNYEAAKVFMQVRSFEKEGAKQYTEGLDWQRIARRLDNEEESVGLEEVLGVSIVEFDVPADKFAKKPKDSKSWVVRQLWFWACLWQDEPADECQFKKRAWLGCWAWKPVALCLQVAVQFITGLFYATYILVASLAVLFAGFRSLPILQGMKDAVLWKRTGLRVLRYYSRGSSIQHKYSYKLWSYAKEEAKYMKFSPIEIVAIIGLIFVFVNNTKLAIGIMGIVLSFAAVIIMVLAANFAASKLMEYFSPKLAASKKLKRETAVKADLVWARSTVHISKRSDEVDLNIEFKGGALSQGFQKAYVMFWEKKEEICKPYDQK